jgi:hypothetical protein
MIPLRSSMENTENKVIKGQYRVGPSGLIYVLPPRAKIRDETIHHATDEGGVIFAITIILAQKGACFESPDLSDKWQYHTVASIVQRWPKVLPDNWLHQLM